MRSLHLDYNVAQTQPYLFLAKHKNPQLDTGLRCHRMNTTAFKRYKLSSVPTLQKTPRLQHKVQMGNDLGKGVCDNRRKHWRNVKAGRLQGRRHNCSTVQCC